VLFCYLITNTGGVPLDNITLISTACGAGLAVPTPLAPGANEQVCCSRNITSSFTDTAFVVGMYSGCPDAIAVAFSNDTVTITFENAHLVFLDVIPHDDITVIAGTNVTFGYTLLNDGNVGITVDLAGTTACPPPIPPPFFLPAGQNITIICYRVLTMTGSFAMFANGISNNSCSGSADPVFITIYVNCTDDNQCGFTNSTMGCVYPYCNTTSNTCNSTVVPNCCLTNADCPSIPTCQPYVCDILPANPKGVCVQGAVNNSICAASGTACTHNTCCPNDVMADPITGCTNPSNPPTNNTNACITYVCNTTTGWIPTPVVCNDGKR
jgi:hypothetical protein